MEGSQVQEEVKGTNPKATREKTVILIGRTGNGKSATGNSILGRGAFKSGFSYSTLTKECEMQQTTLNDGTVLNVVDTPGLLDPSAPQDSVQKEIVKCIKLGKDGIHAILFVVSIKNRFTPEEVSVLDAMQSLFGPEIANYVIVVFTGGDVLESDDVTVDDYFNDCPQMLMELLSRCKKRMVVFNNKTKSAKQKENQVTELLTQIDKISAQNGGQPYSTELFHEAQAMAKQVLVESERVKLQRASYQEKENGQSQGELVEQTINALIEKKLKEATNELDVQLASERSARRKTEKQQKDLEEEKRRLEMKTHFLIEFFKNVLKLCGYHKN